LSPADRVVVDWKISDWKISDYELVDDDEASQLSLLYRRGRLIEYQPVWLGLGGARSLVLGDPTWQLANDAP